MLRVSAQGQTNTSGWTKLELRLSRVADDTVEFDFVGKPAANGHDTITDVSATVEHPLLPPFGPKLVTVVAATGKITRQIEYGGKKRIWEIIDAEAVSDFDDITVAAKGMVATTGWSEPELRRIENDKVEFLALPPG